METARFLALILLPALIQADTGLNVVVVTKEGLWTSKANHMTEMNMGVMEVDGMKTAAVAVNRVDGMIYYNHHGNGKNVIMQLKFDKTSLLCERGNITKYRLPINSYVRGLAYDKDDNTLYWTNMVNSSIHYCKIIDNKCKEAVFLSLNEEYHPAAIAVHNGHLYWTNNNHDSPSVNRTEIRTKDSMGIASTGLFMPNGIAIDTSGSGRIYWTDDSMGEEFKIVSSGLNGEDQRTEVSGHYQRPMDLAFSPPSADSPNGALYWSDWTNYAVWSVNLSSTVRSPRQIINWKDRRIWPMGVAVLYPTKHNN